jgi:hypothetical protein
MSQDLIKVHEQDQLGENSNWFTLLANTAGMNADRTSDLQRCLHSEGLMIEIIISSIGGGVSLVPKILVPNAEGTADLAIVTFTALTAAATTILVLHPNTTNLGSEAKVGTLPRNWKFALGYTGPGTPTVAAYARFL